MISHHNIDHPNHRRQHHNNESALGPVIGRKPRLVNSMSVCMVPIVV